VSQPLLVIAAGGTGGHMFPAQALAETMLRAGWRVTLVTDDRGERYIGGFPHSVGVLKVASATFAGGRSAKIKAPFRIVAGTLATYRSFRRDRPAAVIGFGGYPAVPALSAAVWLRLPRMIHEQNGVLGRANRMFASRMECVACGFWPTELPPGTRGIHTGNPVRRTVAERAGAPYIPPGDHPMEILVIGGSQGARALSELVPPAITSLPPSLLPFIRVSHQARDEDFARVSAFYAEHGVRADVQPFFGDIHKRIAEAQLVISRAGASTLADLTVIGRPSILIPYPHATADHQTANASALADAGGALLLQESRVDSSGLAERIAMILGNPATADEMARAALASGRPDAAGRVAELVVELAKRATAGTETMSVGTRSGIVR